MEWEGGSREEGREGGREVFLIFIYTINFILKWHNEYYIISCAISKQIPSVRGTIRVQYIALIHTLCNLWFLLHHVHVDYAIVGTVSMGFVDVVVEVHEAFDVFEPLFNRAQDQPIRLFL